jgi:hypothetical protein
MIDPFVGTPFDTITLTDAILKVPFTPGRLGQMNLFKSAGITTTSVAVEEYNGTLALIPNTPRGAAPSQNLRGRRKVRNFVVPHFPLEDVMQASEIQGVREFGGTGLQSPNTKRDQILAEMRAKHDATLEYGRIGAVKGIILDADGSSTLINLFTEFGISQTTVDFVLGTATTNILGKCLDVKRAIETALGVGTYTTIRCICGATWFDKFTNHANVKAAYANYLNQGGKQFLSTDSRAGFEFGGIMFEEYRGKVGTVDFIAASECHFFPEGVPSLFKTHFAPGDFLEAVNTPGLPVYAKAEPMEYNRGIKLMTESNPLSLCTRPETLIKGTTSN